MSFPTRRLVFLLLLLTTLGAVGGNDNEPRRQSESIRAEAWPQADALFHSNPKWLGGDIAYSVDLGSGQVLWLFGDTFIATSRSNIRSQSVLVRSSIAIESGYDPATASIRFYWRTQRGRPQSFFPANDDVWYWPADGIVVGNKLFIFLLAVRGTPKGLGFELSGWKAVVVPNFRSSPSLWKMHFVRSRSNRFGIFASGSVIRVGDYVYAFSYQESGANICLVRWPIADVVAEDLSNPQWWDGEAGWVMQRDLGRAPVALTADGQAEFTVNFQPTLNQFLMIQTIGAGQADIGFRRADTPTGPWTPLQPFYRPPENQISDIMIYAAKYHPELRGAQLVLTYATNKFKLAEVVAAPNLYYPRFLRANLNPNPRTAGQTRP
jgi:Domain of unknown function (DUF4185)